MKKIRKILFIVSLVFLSVFPMLFSGCGPTPMSEAKGICFVSEKYENVVKTTESGTITLKCAVFEADLNTPLTLKYKVTPSSWAKESISITEYDAPIDSDQRNSYRKNENIITILSEIYEDHVFKISLNEEEYDFCVVKLKTYPTKIGLANNNLTEFIVNPEIYIPIGGSTQLKIVGQFNSELKILSEEAYNFDITSSDSTVVKVENSTRFTLSAIKKTAGKTTITVKLLDYNREDIVDDENNKLEFTITVNVVEIASAEKSFTIIENSDQFAKNGKEIVLKKSDFTIKTEGGTSYYLIHFCNYLFAKIDRNGEDYDYYYTSYDNALVYSSSSDVIQIDNNNKTIKVLTTSNQIQLTVLCIGDGSSSNYLTNYTYSFTIKFE